ncbi:hypothetical protein [Croceicoccus naphthovorans]|uniref:Uncharacterized protein n=1 Tax=Croceicoccus naphthovorans TaxID=1348774 RepID=A0A0G3XG64_9SPHN|nr:hypothetical protein [Croceicoccus naphthovorans]AKM09616.1 hypothetical protein AB433_05885 [Croceicoccus naphthovorans]MBB3989608.1 hypothetical protein [Croceicoccus naphthovorans]
MQTFQKAIIGTAAAGVMALSGASPTFARDYHDRGGIDAGDVIAGALIIGGIAAVASAASKNNRNDDYYYDRDYRDRRYGDRRYNDRRYNGRDTSRRAVEQCVYAAERYAARRGFRNVDVTDIRDVDRKGRDDFKVKGRIAVDTGYRGGRYGRGWDRDYRGYRDNMRGWDSGRFECEIRNGRVRDIDFKNIRGL